MFPVFHPKFLIIFFSGHKIDYRGSLVTIKFPLYFVDEFTIIEKKHDDVATNRTVLFGSLKKNLITFKVKKNLKELNE